MNDLPRMTYGEALNEVVRYQSENDDLRQALRLILETDVKGLDPHWAVRVARFALQEVK